MTTDPAPGVVVDRLTRRFAARSAETILALDAVSFTMDPMEVLGLLGPNGAGKTTLVKILTTILLPTAGRAMIGRWDVAQDAVKVRPLIGIVFGGERGLYDRLSAVDNMLFWAALYGLTPGLARERARRLLDRVGLTDNQARPVETFSRGMRQRLHLARGLLGDPKILFLDEPTSGLDPVATHAFRDLVRELRAEGRSLFLATHNMDEAQSLCDRVALIDRGRLLAIETPQRLRELSSGQRVEAQGVPSHMAAAIEAVEGVISLTWVEDHRVRVHVADDATVTRVLRMLLEAGASSVGTTSPTLEETYMTFIGRRSLEV